MRSDERGYIVVETIGAFLPLILLVASILSLVNIVTLQARVHYALTQAAETLSMYSYALEVTGVASKLANLDQNSQVVQVQGDELKKNINDVLDGIQSLSLSETVSSGQAAFDQVYDWTEKAVEDPKEMVRILLNYSLNEARNDLFAKNVVRPLVGRYLRNGDQSGDDYLKSARVEGGLDGLEFYDFSALDLESRGANDSVLIDQEGNVKLVVRYEVDYTFGALPLPFDHKLSITQTVKTKAWLHGSGEGYQG